MVDNEAQRIALTEACAALCVQMRRHGLHGWADRLDEAFAVRPYPAMLQQARTVLEAFAAAERQRSKRSTLAAEATRLFVQCDRLWRGLP